MSVLHRWSTYIVLAIDMPTEQGVCFIAELNTLF